MIATSLLMLGLFPILVEANLEGRSGILSGTLVFIPLAAFFSLWLGYKRRKWSNVLHANQMNISSILTVVFWSFATAMILVFVMLFVSQLVFEPDFALKYVFRQMDTWSSYLTCMLVPVVYHWRVLTR